MTKLTTARTSSGYAVSQYMDLNWSH